MNDIVLNTIALLEERKKAFKEKYSGAKVKNFTWLVEREIDSWDKEYFPIYSMLCLPKYQTLIEDHLLGVVDGEITVAKLTETINRVRAKKRKQAQKLGVSHPVVQPGLDLVAVHHPVSHVVGGYGPAVAPNPVVGGGSTSPAIQEPVADSVTSEGGVVLADRKFGLNIPSYVVRKNSLIELVDFSMYPEELERLRSEKEGGFTVAWSGVDETLFKEFIDIVLEYSSRQFKDSEKFDFNGLIKSYIKKAFKTSLADEMLEIYSLLIYKLKKQCR